MAKVRTITAINNAGEKVQIFVYRGYYGRVKGTAAYHTNKYLRDGVKLSDITDNDIFNLGSGRLETAEHFKKEVNEWIKYIYSAFSSLDYYYSLNS